MKNHPYGAGKVNRKRRRDTSRLDLESLERREMLTGNHIDMAERMDINSDGHISPSDVMLVIIGMDGSGDTDQLSAGQSSTDINGDGSTSPIDALMVINQLNSHHVDGVFADSTVSSETDAGGTTVPRQASEIASRCNDEAISHNVWTAVNDGPAAVETTAAQSARCDTTSVWNLTNREFTGRDLHATSSGNANLEPTGASGTDWLVTHGVARVTLFNTLTEEYLAADNWEAFTTPTLSQEAYWRIIDNDDGSISLQNAATGRYLDGDGANEDWNVDESLNILSDDGWFVTDVTHLGDNVAQGVVYSDTNRDGQRYESAGLAEPGLANRTVFVDVNRNAQLDPGEPSTVTESDGTFIIDNAPAGLHSLRVVADADWTATTSSAVDVTIGATVANVDFGQYNADQPYLDANGTMRLQNRDTGRYLYAEYASYSGGGSGYEMYCQHSSPRPEYIGSGTYPTPFVDKTEWSDSLRLCGDGITEFKFTTDEHGTMVDAIYKERGRQGAIDTNPLLADSDRGAFVHFGNIFNDDPTGQPPIAAYWGILLNDDGSISLQSQRNGRYLDADGAPDYGIDTSTELLLDDGWFATEVDEGVITGVVYSDLDQNGTLDDLIVGAGHPFISEAELADQIVYVDLNDNGVWDLDEPADRTDWGYLRGGSFVIDFVPDGTYSLRVETQGDWTPTSSITVAVNGDAITQDIGLYSPTNPYVSIDGKFRLQNLATGRYLYGAYSRQFVDGQCIRDTQREIGTYPELRVDQNDFSIDIQECGEASTEIRIKSHPGYGTVLAGRDFGVVSSPSPYHIEVISGDYSSLRSDAVWGAILNDDGTLSFRNLIRGQYLDADGGPDYGVDLSDEIQDDDKWQFITAGPL